MFPSASVNIGLPSSLVKGMCPGDSGEFVSYKGRGTFSDLTYVPDIKFIISWHPGLKMIFVVKPFLARAKISLTVPCFKPLAALFPDFRNSGYVKQPNVALPNLEEDL